LKKGYPKSCLHPQEALILLSGLRLKKKKRDYEEQSATTGKRQHTADNRQQTANSKHTTAPLFVTMLVPAARGS
jgi:hypothetical protein